MSQMSKVNPFGKLRVDTERSRSIKCQMSKRGGLPRQHLRSFGRGYSIIELLVAVTIFIIIATISTQAVVLTLRGSRKGESLISVRENIDNAFGVMERQLRSARSITSCCPSYTPCTSDTLVYEDSDRKITDFSCEGGATGYLASDSARLTSNKVIVDCTGVVFSCPSGVPGVAPSVSISVTAYDADSQGIEGSSVTTSTRVLLRTY